MGRILDLRTFPLAGEVVWCYVYLCGADGTCPRWEASVMSSNLDFSFPQCRKCHDGELVPLSDFGSQGASIEYKAWVCTNPTCLYNIKIRNGDIIINEPVSDGSMHSYRRNT